MPHALYPESVLEWIFTVAVVTVALCVVCSAVLVCLPPFLDEARSWFHEDNDRPQPPAACGLSFERSHLDRIVRLGDRRRS